MASSFDHCAAVVRKADKDRYLAALFVPAGKRGFLQALYAFDLELSAIAVRVREPLAGEMRLQWWREVLDGRRREEARASPVADALMQTLDRTGLAPAPLHALLDARSRDLYDQPVRSIDELERHATESDGTIFASAARMLGAEPGVALDRVAFHSGVATTIVSALRQLSLHAPRKRLLLPLDVLGRHGVDVATLGTAPRSRALSAALHELGNHGQQHQQAAARLVADLPKQARAAFLPLAVVPLQLQALQGADPFEPTSPAPWRRQWQLWRAARRWLR